MDGSNANECEPMDSNDTETIYYGKETTRLLRRIAKRAAEEVDGDQSTYIHAPNAMDRRRAAAFTGFTDEHMKSIDYNTLQPLPLKQIDRRDVQSMLANYYLDFKYLPTTTALYTALKPLLPECATIDYFRRKLVQMGYCWKVIGKDKYNVIIENPKIKFERYMYLRKITKYRQDNRSLCFIGLSSVLGNSRSSDGSVKRQHFAYAVINNTIKFFKYYLELDETEIEKLLIEHVIPNVPPNIVVIFNDSKHVSKKICKAPDLDSLKVEMIDWLDFHGVPYTNKMSKAELFMLIEKFTDVHENLYTLDILLKKYGHEVLRTPSCISGVSPTALVERLVAGPAAEAAGAAETAETADLLQGVSEELLKQYNEEVAKEEQRILEEEVEIERIWDTMIKNINSKNLSVAEINDFLPELSDSESE